MLIEELYDALKEAGASEEKAKAAARAIATYENQFADIRGILKLHSWILSTNTAMLVALLFKVFSK